MRQYLWNTVRHQIPTSTSTVSLKIHTHPNLKLVVVHYFYFSDDFTHNSLSEFFKAEGGKQKHFKAEADEDYMEKRETSTLSIGTWIALIIFIFWEKKLKPKTKLISRPEEKGDAIYELK